MHCPFCGHEETKVNDSRLAAEGRQIRRRRECLACGERFTTFEAAELVMPLVVKSHGSREAYVRFASVYRSFQDVEAFRDEVEKLRSRRRREPLAGQLSLLAGGDSKGADDGKSGKGGKGG